MSPIFCNKGHENPTGSLFCQTCGEKLSPPPAKLMLSVGEVLEGRYRIAQQIGQGGFGRTYLCENLNRFNEPCVLKEFAPQVQGVYALNKAKTLFEREANVLHQLTHPQIPRFRELFQVNSSGGGLFLVQDYVAGLTYRYLLGQRMLKNETFSEAEVRKFLLDVLPVLEYIHSLGVIHRDIAPDNLILRSSDNLPVLIDFGGVKQLAVNAEIQAIGGTDLPTCLGKVGYAPHEQLQRGQTYPHSDLYALAATALVLATGKEPTSLIDPQNLQWNWRNHVTLGPKFGEVLDRMLHPNISARFQSATEAIAALQAIGVTQAKSSNTVGTVVIAPGGAQPKGHPQGRSGVMTAPGGGQGELWPILKRSWLALAGVAVVGTGGWAAYKTFSGSTTSTPAPGTSPAVVESPAGSASATPSPSASERSSETTPESSTSSKPSVAATNADNSSGNDSSSRRAKANSDSTPRRSAKPEAATSSRNTQPEAPSTPPAPTTPKPETVSDAENTPAATNRPSVRRSTEDTPPATPQRSRSSSNRQSSGSEWDNAPSSEPRRPSSSSSESSPPSRSRSSSGESSTPRRASGSSGELSTPSRTRRSTEDADNGGSSQRTARESNSNRSRSSSPAPRNSGSSGASSTKPSEEPLF